MEEDFCTGRLRDRHGIDAVVPDDHGRVSFTASSMRSSAGA
jgi:hypothetical protein